MTIDRPTVAAGAPDERDRGAALVIVLFWAMGMAVLALLAGQSVLERIRPSDQAEQSFRAWTAAEAGVEDFRARVAAAQNGDITPATQAATNPAVAGWVPLPGGDSGDTRFTYTVDASRASSSGRIVITSTGYAGGQYRTVYAELAKETMFDYAYASNYETVAPRYPPYYLGGSQQLTRAQAQEYCGDRYWYESGSNPPVSAASNQQPNHRDSTACVGGLIANWALGANDQFVGRVHTNDVFVLATDSGNLPIVPPTQIFTDIVTSACPEATAVNVGCAPAHRWIAGNVVDGSGYVVDETQGVPAQANWNPGYETQIEIRNEGLAVLKARAKEAGCLFTGPTRLRFYPDGTVAVTSPDSRTANPTTAGINCGGTGLAASTSDPRTPRPDALTRPASADGTPTGGGDLGSAFNGLIYVQDVPAYNGALPADSQDPNAWATDPPSCLDKNPGTNGVQPFPYVPTASSVEGYVDNDGYSSLPAVPGFPPYGANYTGNQRERFSTDLDTDSTSSSCRQGTAYVEGRYLGRWTIVTEGDVAITSDIIDSSVPANMRPNRTTTPSANRTPPAGWGRPSPDSNSVMGIVPDRLLYVYGCGSNEGCVTYDRVRQTTNLVLNMATVVTDGCLTVMDSTITSSFGRLTFIGSLGQKYRCPIAKPTGNSGFNLYVEYDTRFSRLDMPPFMAELSQEAWRIQRMQEIGTDSVTLPGDPTS